MSDHETIHAAGETRVLNLQPSSQERLVMVPTPRVTIPTSAIVPYDQWPAAIKVKDQGQAGACNGHATVETVEYMRYQGGQPHVPLSAWWTYGQLVHGRDVGSNILDALELTKADGCAPESVVRYGDFSGNYGEAANTLARQYRIASGVRLTDWSEILTAVALREAVNLSIRVGNNFNAFDADGCPGVGKGAANHAVMVAGGIKKGRKGNLLVRMLNSWGTTWGQKGFCWLSEDHIQYATWFEAFCCSVVVEDMSDGENPPAAPAA